MAHIHLESDYQGHKRVRESCPAPAYYRSSAPGHAATEMHDRQTALSFMQLLTIADHYRQLVPSLKTISMRNKCTHVRSVLSRQAACVGADFHRPGCYPQPAERCSKTAVSIVAHGVERVMS